MEFVRAGRPVEMFIMNPEKKKAWVLNAEDKTYMEIRFAEKPWQKTGKDREGLKEKKLGRETVVGYACEKTAYSFEDEAAGADRDEESEVAGIVKDDAKDIASDAKGAAKDEVTGIVTDSVREGIRGLFRK